MGCSRTRPPHFAYCIRLGGVKLDTFNKKEQSVIALFLFRQPENVVKPRGQQVCTVQ
ncbi:MAG: hypothetical protein J5680_07055 [Neisseriaceae bacterium]|nr:hypothetical protein [Neisseriaceae bacterium]